MTKFRVTEKEEANQSCYPLSTSNIKCFSKTASKKISKREQIDFIGKFQT